MTQGSSTPQLTPDELNALTQFIQNLMNNPNVRQDFNPKSASFWTTLGAVAAIVLAWINPNTALGVSVQTAITAVGGLVILLFAHSASTQVPVSKIAKLVSKLPPHASGLIAKVFTPTPLVPSPAGQTGPEGYYPPGTTAGSVLPPGSVVITPPVPGVAPGTGGVGEGLTNEGNVSPNITVNVQQGPYPNPNAETYSPISPTAPLPGQVGSTTSVESPGGSVGQQQGPYDPNADTEAPGAYVPPPANPANPDEAGSTTFVAKDVPPHRRAPRK